MTEEQKAETSFHAALLSKRAKALSSFGIPQKIYLQVQKLSSPYLQDNLLVCHKTSHKPTA